MIENLENFFLTIVFAAVSLCGVPSGSCSSKNEDKICERPVKPFKKCKKIFEESYMYTGVTSCCI